MTRSIRKKQKQLRKQSKAQSPYAQSPRFWANNMRERDKLKDDLGLKAYRVRNLPQSLARKVSEQEFD